LNDPIRVKGPVDAVTSSYGVTSSRQGHEQATQSNGAVREGERAARRRGQEDRRISGKEAKSGTAALPVLLCSFGSECIDAR
jgi:hypothetical protein